jgi:NAD/NADP transhydrogenase beta subunit
MRRFRSTPVAYVLIGMAIGGAIGACSAGADQPNMVAALNSLRAARAELIQATPNKGGHRDRAINFVDAAIHETEAGIAYAGY